MGIMKTAIEWAEQYSVYHPVMSGEASDYDVLILDPDGWPRKNFKDAFMDNGITKESFFEKLESSTIRGDYSDIKELGS